MISRRSFVQLAAGAYASAALPSYGFAYPTEAAAGDVLHWVDPRIGTGGHGHCFPGACVPFGAVQLSPDTYNDEWDWCSGYHISNSSIMGFSHTHLSGTGCGDLLDFLVMAGTGPVKLAPGPRFDPDQGYRSRFSRTEANEAILVRTGISGVSAEGAARNLQAEQADWDFGRARAAAQGKWREQLGRVQAEFADPEQKRTFYTALYHMSIGPTLYDDVDGQYRGMDKRIHTLPQGQRNYTCFSLWDTFRAAHPAYTIIQSDRVPQFVNTLLRMADESPEGVPVWPLQSVETGGMTGYHSASVIAEAMRKGIPGIDAETVYKAFWRRSMAENFRGMGYYRQLGYLPADRESESVSECFEYCYDDWAVANIAYRTGRKDEAALLVARSHSFNPASQFMEPKLFDGSWAKPFDPIALGHSSQWRDYTESNAWQTSFGVQHDHAGLIALYGGRERFVKRLDMLFTVPSTLSPDAPLDIAGLIGQYAHGNEPSHHIAYLYVYAGAPYKTQERVRMIMDTLYHAAPDGMAGNEDVGQMSAWYVLSALGFYAVDPVGATYVLGSPLVDRAVVNVGHGNRLVMDVRRSSPKDMYVHAVTLNGVSQQRAWFRHADIAGGGHILLEMGASPNLAFGSGAGYLPPSLKL